MSREKELHGEISKNYLFLKPETLLSPDTKKRLSDITVVQIAPPWLPVPRALRKYGGTEDVIDNLVHTLAMFGVGEQRLYGHKDNAKIRETLPTLTTHTPNTPDAITDPFLLFQEEPDEAVYFEGAYTAKIYDELANDPSISIIHDHTVMGRSYAQRIHSAPVIITEHERVGESISPGKNYFFSSFGNEGDAYSIAISDSLRQQNDAMRWLSVIHHGVNIPDFEYKAKKNGHPKLGHYGLFVGLVSPAKGTDLAIAAAEKADMPLIIAGPVEQSPTSLEFFDTKVKPHLSDKIRYIGPVGKEERTELMAEASWLAMLNRWHEPFGLVMAEALASGTPVVGTRKGSIPEIVEDGETGYVVDGIDEASNAVNKIMRGEYDPLACRRNAEMRFSTPVMTAKYVLAYLELIDRHSRRSQRKGYQQIIVPQR